MTIADVNNCDRQRFVDLLGWIFEGSPWVAARAWPRRPFKHIAQLHAVMMGEVMAAARPEQLALLCAHPDLGTRATMSEASVGEQAGAGLDRLSRATFERLQHLTGAYREKYGFPFLLAVKGRTATDVLETLEARLVRSAEEEWVEALAQVGLIAERRLHDLIQ